MSRYTARLMMDEIKEEGETSWLSDALCKLFEGGREAAESLNIY